ncbi:MAG: hypothetical protein HYU84_04880 [Chloroflexi bacterium]|nr:hypothetical protein [Chloroflexota bacterium]MBI3168992.1 hypothetical protein [Chloroflexota bacterium]
MKRQYLTIAILALLLPALLRGLWYYRGFPSARPEVATPDYASFSRPAVAINTPDLENVEQLGGTVLLDTAHYNQFTLSEIDALASAIRARGGNIKMIVDPLLLENELKSSSAYITVSPTLPFFEYEAQALKNFTERGGKILVFTDATRYFLGFDYISGNPIPYGDVNAANSLLKLWDISVNNDYLYNTEKNEGNFRNVLFDDFAKNELTFGLSEVALYGARSVESASGLILLQGAETNLSSTDDAHDPNAGGAVLSEDETVAAFGDFTFLSPPYSTYIDNAVLIQNMADFILSGERAANLDVFPYLFKGKTVKVYVSSELEKSSSLISAMGTMQSTMRFLNYKLEFVDDLPTSGDAIIIGSFEATDEFDAYLKKADVEIDSDVLSTVAFGDVSRSGNGLLLFNATNKGNTLVMLADTPDDIISLLGVMGYSGLSSCLTSDQVAVCSVGSGDYYYDDYSGEETPAETTTEGSTEQAPEEATPTPSG